MIEKELDYIKNYLQNIFSDNSGIYYDINQFLNGPSKRIRSVLAILYLKANNKELSKEIYNILIAGEIIHNASLLHDDIIDNNNKRRGDFTIGEKYSPQLSILSGDLLLSIAAKILLEVKNHDILNRFFNCTKNMSEAEIRQYSNRGTKPTNFEYKNICNGKTAKLFETILESCAILADLEQKNAQKLGKSFGLLFQIKNDISELSRDNDKKNQVYTAYDIFGVEKTHNLIDNYKEEILSIISEYPNARYRREIEELVLSL